MRKFQLTLFYFSVSITPVPAFHRLAVSVLNSFAGKKDLKPTSINSKIPGKGILNESCLMKTELPKMVFFKGKISCNYAD